MYEALKTLYLLFKDDRLIDDEEFQAEVLKESRILNTTAFVERKIHALRLAREALAKEDL